MDTEKTAPAAATIPLSAFIEIENRPRMFFPVANFVVSLLVRCRLYFSCRIELLTDARLFS